MTEFNVNKYQDLQLNDKALYEQFLSYWKNGDYQNALFLVDNNAQLSTKSFVAGALNTIGAALTYLQNNYFENVEAVLANKLNEFNLEVVNFQNQHAYSLAKQYYVNNFVLYNGLYYMCIKNAYNVLPTNTVYWALIGLVGEQGAAGTGLNLRYSWNDLAQYNQYDVVYYQSILYVAKQANTNQDPTTATTYWELLMKVPTTSITYGVPTDPYEGQVWAKVL